MPKIVPKTAGHKGRPHAVDPNPYIATIDLPGETVQGWCSSNKIKVILRKHRDVLFDIRLFKGMVYTVHSEQSAFYDARQKKIVLKRRKISFNDGDRVHLWISREFKGALVLKANGKVLGRYDPSNLDPAAHDAAPTTKPAPLLVVLQNEAPEKTPPRFPTETTVARALPSKTIMGSSPTAIWAESQIPQAYYPVAPQSHGAGDPTMHVIEIKREDPGLPREIGTFFKSGGEQTALDTNGQLTRNWLLSNIIGVAAYYDDNKLWINDLWKEKFYIQRVNHAGGPKWYIVFRGSAQTRQFITASRYGISHTKVLAITSGIGSTAGLRHGTWDAAKGSLRKAGGFAVLFTIALDTAEWLKDFEERDPKTGLPKKDFFDLVLKIGVDLAKAGLSAALGAVAMGALVFAGFVTGGAAVVIGAIVLSVVIGLTIDYFDKKTGATDRLNQLLRDGVIYLEKKMPTDYGNYDSSLQQALAYGGMGA